MPIKNTMLFPCGNGVIHLKYVEEYAEEFRSGTPVVRRAYIHGDHAHLVKFDVQGGDRGNDIMDFYENAPEIPGKTNIEYTCEICHQHFKFGIQPKSQQPNHSDSDLGIPAMLQNYQFMHIHNAGSDHHAYHLRVNAQGKILLGKFVKFVVL
jgi:hypothetical protein